MTVCRLQFICRGFCFETEKGLFKGKRETCPLLLEQLSWEGAFAEGILEEASIGRALSDEPGAGGGGLLERKDRGGSQLSLLQRKGPSPAPSLPTEIISQRAFKCVSIRRSDLFQIPRPVLRGPRGRRGTPSELAGRDCVDSACVGMADP